MQKQNSAARHKSYAFVLLRSNCLLNDCSISKPRIGSNRIFQEWVVFAFCADRRIGPMAARDGVVVRKRKYVRIDRSDELFVVSARKVSPADRSAEKAVAGKHGFRRVFDQDDMSRRMPGTVPDLEFKITDLQYLAVLDKSTRIRRVIIVHP